MQLVARKTLFLAVPLQLCLLAGPAGAQDGSSQPSQIATAVAGKEAGAALPAGHYAVQNDLLSSLSLSVRPEDALEGGWIGSSRPPDIPDPRAGGTIDRDPLESFLDPDEPRGIYLSEGIRGRFKAKNGAAIIGLAIGFAKPAP